MNPTALQILTLSLCAIALAACFVRRVSAALIAYGAMVCAFCGHRAGITIDQLTFWGCATAIVLGLRFLQREDRYSKRAARAYVAGGATVGAFLGVLIAPVSGTVIAGSALGTLLGAIAYMRLPSGLHFAIGSREFVDFICVRGLPAIVGTSILAITTAAVLYNGFAS